MHLPPLVVAESLLQIETKRQVQLICFTHGQRANRWLAAVAPCSAPAL